MPAEEVGRQVARGHVTQDSRTKTDPLEIRGVGGQRHLARGAALDIVGKDARQPPSGRAAEILDHAAHAGLLLLQTVHEGGTLYLFGPRCDLLNLMIAGCFSSLWDEEQETGLHIPEARSLAGTLFGKHPEQARKLLAARLLCLELHTLSLRMIGRLIQHLYEARRRNMISGLLLLVSPYTPESLRDQLLETFKDGGFTIVRAFISLVGKRCVSLYGGLEPELTLDSRHEGSVRWSGEP